MEKSDSSQTFTSSENNKSVYYICDVCAHNIPAPADHRSAMHCPTCGHTNHRLTEKDSFKALIFTLTAVIFYIPANLLPFMSLEFYGNINKATIWSGIMSLAESGSWFIAIVVFVASMLVPFLKLAIMLYLTLTSHTGSRPRFKTQLYGFVEAIGRWSMIDIFLLTILVAIMKIASWTSVHAEVGALMFLLVVIFTMLASSFYDPKLIWKNVNEKQD